MSFFISRAAASASSSKPSQDRADIFARGDHAVLVVADGSGGRGDGGRAADVFLERVRDAVLDASFDLLSNASWRQVFTEVDAELPSIGETTAVVVVLAPGILLCVACGDSEAWIVRPNAVDDLTEGADRVRLGSGRARPSASVRRALDGRLLIATDGLFHPVDRERILLLMRAEAFGKVADALVASARLPSGELADDIAVLVADI